MAVERWMPRWARELDDELSQMLGQQSGYWQESVETGWAPSVDLTERPEDILVEVDLPGVDRSTLEVTVEQSLLTIKAERKAATVTSEQSTCYCHERPHGSFYRSIRLPEIMLSDKVEAAYDDGVLRIILTKRPEAKLRKIEIAPSNGTATNQPTES